ncbi:hypothetical protein AgCh_025201 [Apium graveolens]
MDQILDGYPLTPGLRPSQLVSELQVQVPDLGYGLSQKGIGMAHSDFQFSISGEQGIPAPSPDVQERVRSLTQAIVERARTIDHFISSEFRAVQYQDLVNWLVFELGSIGGGGSGSVKPPEFKGEVDPIAARVWLKEMEKAFTFIQKVRRFQQGLKPEVRSGVVALQLKTYTSIVQAALVIESDQKLASKERSDKKRKFESGADKEDREESS